MLEPDSRDHECFAHVHDCQPVQEFQFSPEYSMLTPPRVGPNSEVYFIAWADSGQATDDGTNE